MFPFYKFQGDILHKNFSKYLKIRKIRECTAYAEKNGITIVKHYIDRAISAKTDNRPEFQQMIKEMTEVYPLRGMYLGHFYFSVVSAGITPYSSALTGSA